MHDAVGALGGPKGATPAMPIPISRSRFLAGARITGTGTFDGEVSGDPTDPIDRLRSGDCGALALRHCELPGRDEAAQVLGITQEAGAKEDFRALKPLKDVLATMPGGWGGP